MTVWFPVQGVTALQGSKPCRTEPSTRKTQAIETSTLHHTFQRFVCLISRFLVRWALETRHRPHGDPCRSLAASASPVSSLQALSKQEKLVISW